MLELERLEQRIGGINFGGGFEAAQGANGTDTTQRFFEVDFPIGAAGFETSKISKPWIPAPPIAI